MNPSVERHCQVCGSAKKAVMYGPKLPETGGDGKLLHHHYENEVVQTNWHYRIVRCEGCEHRYADPIFDSALVEGSYLEQEHDNSFGLDMGLLLKTQAGYAKLVEDVLPADKRRVHVDVGCDIGLFMRATKDIGFKSLVGIEPGVDSAREAAKIPGAVVKQKIFEAADFEKDSVDLLSLIHVMDHLVDARAFLREVKSVLAPGGVCLAVVHNIGSAVAKISGEGWAPLNLMHMDYYAPSTLRKLFEAEGFEVVRVVHTKNYFPLSHLVRFAPHLTPGIRALALKVVRMWPFNRIVLGLKLGNIAIVARRKDTSLDNTERPAHAKQNQNGNRREL